MSKKKLLLTLAITLFLLFVYFSYLVHKGKFNQLDFDTTVRLQDHISHRFDFPFSILSVVGSAEISGLIWVGVLIYFLLKRYYKTVVLLFLFWGGVALELYGKVFVYHPAPPYMFYRGAIKFAFPSSYVNETYSYPSGHSIRLTYLAVLILTYLYLSKFKTHRLLLQFVMIGFLVAVYISRIYLGEHWFSDVVGGAMLGGSLAMITALSLP